MNNLRYCTAPGCTSLGHHTGKYRIDGTIIRRSKCAKHHTEHVARINGYDKISEYINSIHPYRRYRKNYCENTMGFLGFTCTATIVDSAQLDVDHIDGNPENNDVNNLQTLCKNCHTMKTLNNKDYLTPGRKALGLTY
jgi:hypothetical protein